MLGVVSFIKIIYYIFNTLFTLVLLYYLTLIFFPNLSNDIKLFLNYIYYNIILKKPIDNDSKDDNKIENEIDDLTGIIILYINIYKINIIFF